MDSYKTLLFLHILSAVVAIGSTFAFPFLQAWAERSGVAATRFTMQFLERFNKVMTIPGSLLLIAFGVGLIFNDVTGYKDDFPTWLMVAITLFGVVILLGILHQQPVVQRAIVALEGVPDGKTLPAAYETLGKRFQIVGGLQGLLIVVIIFLMVWKPGQ